MEKMDIDHLPGATGPSLTSVEGLNGSKWNMARLGRLLEDDSSDSDEDTRFDRKRPEAGDLCNKKPKLEPFKPHSPLPPRGRVNATAPSRPRRLRQPLPPSRLVTVDRLDYEKYLDWVIGQQRKGWAAEEKFVASNRNWQPSSGYLAEMADGDRRGYNRGYGGGGGGGGRKRKFYGDDDDFDRARPRRDYARKPPLSQRVREQVFSIGDAVVRNAEEDCAELADIIAQNEEDSYFLNHILDMIPLLVVEQPLKVPHAAAIVLHLNDKKPELSAQIVEKSRQMAQKAIENGEWRTFKLLLRFFACMHSMFEGSTIMAVLEELFSRASDLQMASSEDALGIELVKIIQLTIPFALASGAPGLEQPVAELLEKTEIIVSAPQESTLSIYPYASTETEEAPKLHTFIGMLQAQLQIEAQEGYPLKIIPRLYKKVERKPQEEDDSAMDGESMKHPFPALAIPDKLAPGPRALFPEVFFSLYADQDVETVPPMAQLAASIIRDVCVDTINILDFNRTMVVKYLIDVDNYFPKGTFAKRGISFDKIRDAQADESTWKTEDLLMDAFFSQLMTLPAPEHKLVYYHSCITVACREAASAVAPSLGRAIRFLYSNMDVLDLELGYRFMDWFSHHLSNYDYRWKWQEWASDVSRSPLTPKNAFMRGVLDKEIRLSFARRIRESLPDEYGPLVPPSKDNDIPPFKYNTEGAPFAKEAQTILNALKLKQPDTDILPTLESITEQARTADSSTAALPAIDAYATAICFIGSKSLSHVLSFIERCKHRLLAFSREAPDPTSALAARTQIVESVVEYWRPTQAGVAVNLVDKLTNYGMVSPPAVVAWALGAGDDLPASLPRANPQTSLCEAWMFEMVSATLNKVTNRVRQIIAARLSAGLPAAQLAQLDDTLNREAAEMGALFATVERALEGIAAGAAGGDNADSAALLRWWGSRWLRVFERKRRVEERLLAEARLRFPGPVADVEMDTVAPADGSGAAAGQADGDGDGDVDGV